MAQIGILHGDKESFPQGVLEELNRHRKGCCQFLKVDALDMDRPESGGWDTPVILDLFSRYMPFLNESLYLIWQFSKTRVFNEPRTLRLHNRATVRFLAKQSGMKVGKALMLPAKDCPKGFPERGFINLRYPIDWEGALSACGAFPLLQRLDFDGDCGVLIQDLGTLWRRYNETGISLQQLVSPPSTEELYRVFVVGEARFVRPLEPLTRQLLPSKLAASKEVRLLEATEALLSKLPLDIVSLDLGLTAKEVEYVDLNPDPDLEWWTLGEHDFALALEGAVKMLTKHLPPKRKTTPRKRKGNG